MYNEVYTQRAHKNTNRGSGLMVSSRRRGLGGLSEDSIFKLKPEEMSTLPCKLPGTVQSRDTKREKKKIEGPGLLLEPTRTYQEYRQKRKIEGDSRWKDKPQGCLKNR